MWDWIKAFFEKIGAWLSEGIWDWAAEVVAYWVEWYTIAVIKAKIWAVQFSWSVAENILVNVGISEMLASSWASIDPTMMSYLMFFRLPEGINILLNAVVTRFVMRTVF